MQKDEKPKPQTTPVSAKPNHVTITQKNTIRIWACLPDTIIYLQDLRILKLPDQILHGLNYSIIVNACCFVEGVFESALIRLYQAKAPKGKTFDENPDTKVIRKASSLKRYDATFKETVGLRFMEMTEVAPLHEDLEMLFTIRHLLAHGRASVYTFTPNFEEVRKKNDVAQQSNYDKLEDYLIKNKFYSRKEEYMDLRFLNSEVADHFASTAARVIIAVIKSLDVESASVFQTGAGPLKHFVNFAANLEAGRSRAMMRHTRNPAQVDARSFSFGP